MNLQITIMQKKKKYCYWTNVYNLNGTRQAKEMFRNKVKINKI